MNGTHEATLSSFASLWVKEERVFWFANCDLVAIMFGLVRSLRINTYVGGLLGGQFGELDT